MNQVALKFYSRQKNPARASGRGVYRVEWCTPLMAGDRVRITVLPGHPASITIPPLLLLHSLRKFKRGSRVDPLKIALEVADPTKRDAASREAAWRNLPPEER